jgi:phosphoglycolate phosphatase-like HAD superfamily hydrolase
MPGTHGTGNRDIKGVIFDMDNTLFDFIEAKLSACNAIVDCLGAGDLKIYSDIFSVVFMTLKTGGTSRTT